MAMPSSSLSASISVSMSLSIESCESMSGTISHRRRRPCISPRSSPSCVSVTDSGSGRVAHAPVRISSASCTVLSWFSSRSSSSCVDDLWSDFGACFGGAFSISSGSFAWRACDGHRDHDSKRTSYLALGKHLSLLSCRIKRDRRYDRLKKRKDELLSHIDRRHLAGWRQRDHVGQNSWQKRYDRVERMDREREISPQHRTMSIPNLSEGDTSTFCSFAWYV